MDKQKVIERIFAGTPFLVRGKAYHSQLPPELAEWYCYLSDSGHNILCQLEGQFDEGNPDWKTLCPCPVKAVLRGYRVVGDFVVVDLPYSEEVGLMTRPEDNEF